MHRHTARYHRRYQGIAIPKNLSALAARGYASAHHDCVSGRGRVNGHGHHRANGHVNGRRVRDHGHLYVDGRDRGHHHANGHVNGRRARDHGRLCANGRDRGRLMGRVGANDRASAGADGHVPGCVRHHCNTASCFW